MSDPTHPVQVALMERLTQAVPSVGGRVWDSVPNGKDLEYLTVSMPSVVPIDEDHWDRTEMTCQIDAWSLNPDSGVVKRIASEIRQALHERDDIVVAGFTIDRIRVDGIFYSREEQTLLNRARVVVTVEAQPS